jgi:hypothetical protein
MGRTSSLSRIMNFPPLKQWAAAISRRMRLPRQAAWNFLNQPIIANSAAVILVAIFGFAFTNYYQCKAQSLADSIKLDELFNEVLYRHTKLLGAINANELQPDRFDHIKRALNPETTFFFLENKGKAEREIRDVIASVVYKWRVLYIPPKSEPGAIGQPANWEAGCDINQIEQNPDPSKPCESTYFDEFTNPASSVDFQGWLQKANDAGEEQAKRAQFLDYIGSYANLLLGYRQQGTGLQANLSRVVVGMSNAAHEDRFFPRRMCLCRSIWQ